MTVSEARSGWKTTTCLPQHRSAPLYGNQIELYFYLLFCIDIQLGLLTLREELRMKDDIKMDLAVIACENVDWISLD
jgi:hypothetical protein